MRSERRIVNDKLWNFVNSIDRTETNIKMYNDLIKDLENPLKATKISGMPSAHGKNSTIECAVMLLDKYTKKINESIIEKENILTAFNDYIAPLPLRLQQIIRYRYFDCFNPTVISFKVACSVDSVKKNMAKAKDILYNYWHK